MITRVKGEAEKSGRHWNQGRFLFPLFEKAEKGKLGIRDGSFSHFSLLEKRETGNQGRFLFPLFVPRKVGKGTVPDFQFPSQPSQKWEKEPSLIPTHFLQWHILHPCNLHCRHCYQEDYNAMMPWPDMLSLLDKYTAFLALHDYQGQINLTGGEPLMHPDFLRLAREIRARSIRLAVLTNGTLIDDAMAAALSELRPVFVQISLDGPPAIHDEIRGPGSFDKAMRGVDLLKKYQVKVLISFTAMKTNYNHFAELASICSRHYVDKLWWDRVVTDDRALFLTTEEFRSIAETATRLARRYKFIRNERAMQWLPAVTGCKPFWRCKNGSAQATEADSPQWLQRLRLLPPRPAVPCIYQCSAGKRLLIALANGDLMACRRLPFVIGNIKDSEDLAEIVDNSPIMHDLAKPAFPEKCVKCEHFLACRTGGRCVTYAQTGRLDLPDVNCYL